MTKAHIDEIQNDLQVIIDIANFTRVIDVETDEIFKLQMCQKFYLNILILIFCQPAKQQVEGVKL